MPGCGIRFRIVLSTTTFNNPEQVWESDVCGSLKFEDYEEAR